MKSAVKQGLFTEDSPLAMFWNLTEFQAQVKEAQAAFPGHFLHTVATKANPLLRIIQAGAEVGAGSEAASLGELVMACRGQSDAKKIMLDSPAKTTKEIERALELGVGLTIDNLQELDRVDGVVAAYSARHGRAPASLIGVRINPQIGAGKILTHSVSKPWSKFGIPATELRAEVVAAYATRPWLNCMHVHAGSQTYSLQQLATAIALMLEIAADVNAAAVAATGARQITTVDIGGGLPVNFASEANEPAFSEWATVLREAAPALFTGEYAVITEQGRRYLAKQGFIASRVEYVKQAGGRRVVLQHAGADIAVRTVYKPDAWPLRVTAFRADGSPFPPAGEDAAALLPADVAGPCCIDDVIAPQQRPLPPVAQGDYIIFHDTGAYFHSAWSYYNCRQTPALYCFYERAGEEEVQFELIRPASTVDETLEFFMPKSQ
jgi:diaminopimelate decarboxylase